VLGLALPAPAWGQSPFGPEAEDEDPEGAGDDFWGRVHRPLHQRYLDLLEEGRLHVEARRFGEAASTLGEAVRAEPGHADASFFLAMAHRGQGHYAACADALHQVAELDPAFVPPEGQAGTRLSLDFHMAFCLAIAGRVAESIPHYQRVLAEAPQGGSGDVWLVHWNLGDSFHALGHLGEAIEEYRRGAELVPGEAMLHFALGVAYDRDGQAARAQGEVQLGLAVDPFAQRPTAPDVQFVPAHDKEYYLGLAHEVAGRRAGALVYFRRYVAMAGEGSWGPRAKEHLDGLGPGGLQPGDVELHVEEAGLRQSLLRAVLGQEPELQRCLAGQPYAWVQVTVVGKAARAAPAGKPGPAKKAVALVVQAGSVGPEVVSLGPVEASPEALACVSQRALRLTKLLAGRSGAVVFPVIAPR
jgi:tetratricopeptide (TPR) repeat protein